MTKTHSDCTFSQNELLFLVLPLFIADYFYGYCLQVLVIKRLYNLSEGPFAQRVLYLEPVGQVVFRYLQHTTSSIQLSLHGF